MPDSVEEIKRRYAEEAKTYRRDALKINFEAQQFSELMLKYIKEIFPEVSSTIKVLDIGAGTGMLTESLLKEYPNAHVTLLDNSAEMLEQARSYFEVAGGGINNLSFYQADFVNEEFPKEKFDLVISSFALHHIRTHSDLVSVFNKIYQVLKPNHGTFLCIDLFLANTLVERKKQVKIMVNTWEEKGLSSKEAISWAHIIESEDTPATWQELLRSLLAVKSMTLCGCTPLISPYCGKTTGIYGFSLYPNLLDNSLLSELVYSWNEPNKGPVVNFQLVNSHISEIKQYPVSETIDEKVIW